MALSIDMKPVASTAITAVGYDRAAKTVRIEFRNGRVHDFPNVEADEHASLVGAESVGRHFNQHFGGRKHRRVA